jgi:hypothetical protein
MNLSNNIIAAFAAISCTFCVSYIAESPAQFVAILFILTVASIVAYVSFRVLKFVLNIFFPLSPSVTKEAVQPQTNKRVRNTNRKNSMSADRLMAIPAYARKESNRYFPMNKDFLQAGSKA